MRMRGALERALSATSRPCWSDTTARARVDDVLAAFSALASRAVFADRGRQVRTGRRAVPRKGHLRRTAMGSPQVMAQTRSTRRVGRLAELRTLWDVDRVQDLERWLGRSD
jgi:hypothetical protein